LNKLIVQYEIPFTLKEPYICDTTMTDYTNLYDNYDIHSMKLYGTNDIPFTDDAFYEDNIAFTEYYIIPIYEITYFQEEQIQYYTHINETFECPISMMEVNEGYITICNHKFGKENLINWLEVDTKKSCPLCRTKLHE
jgi:hypothetical protein